MHQQVHLKGDKRIMEHENLKIKTFDEQITSMINASGLPSSILYYMFKGYTLELEKLFEKTVDIDRIDLSSTEEEIKTEVNK